MHTPIVTYYSAEEIQTRPLPGDTALIRLADTQAQLIEPLDRHHVRQQLDVIVHDARSGGPGLVQPGRDHAAQIVQFVRACEAPHVVAQCQAGVGRSQAVAAAILAMQGYDNRPILAQGTYNRALYREILHAAGLTVPADPLVSMVIRVKYDAENLMAFLLSMRRQRYENWELVAVTDGLNPAAVEVSYAFDDPRLRLLQMPEPRGYWGHPYRQVGIEIARGEWIGLSNDDNYYAPGYLEQMVYRGEQDGADVVLSEILHSYHGWQVVTAGSDLGAFLARRSIVQQVTWPGVNFDADQVYVRQLCEAAKGRVTVLRRPLFVKN